MKTRTIQLGELCRTTSGGTPSRENPLYYGGDIPWVKSGELNDSIVNRTDERITKLGLKNSNAEIFPAGTLLIALYGATAGKLGVLGMDAATNQAICAIFSPDGLNEDFLRFYLLSMRSHLIEHRTGGAQPNISQDVIRKLLIPLPTLFEQQRIARQLHEADRLRRMRRYALELSDKFLQSVFLEMFRDRRIASENVPLGDLIRSGPTNGLYKAEEFLGDGVLFLDIKGLYRGLEADFTSARRMRVSEKELKKYQLSNGDVLINRVSKKTEGVGKTVLVSNLKERAVYESNMMRIRLNESKVLPGFLVHYLSTAESRRQLLRSANISNQASINQDSVNGLQVFVPPLSRQQTFVNLVNRFARLRAQQREAGRQAEHLFQTLLHHAFAEQL